MAGYNVDPNDLAALERARQVQLAQYHQLTVPYASYQLGVNERLKSRAQQDLMERRRQAQDSAYTPYVANGLENSGVAGRARNRFQLATRQQELDILDAYNKARAQLLYELARNRSQIAVDSGTAVADLYGTSNSNWNQIFGGS